MTTKLLRIKNIFLCLVALLISLPAYLSAQTPFITTWKTDNPGASNSTSITLSVGGSGINYDV
ncbi:MAG: hypothetical protein OEM26_18205, partial [Saprospiraceae bacterium]|nr:hypothetical protein [Saprospiraceae bacterium]